MFMKEEINTWMDMYDAPKPWGLIISGIIAVVLTLVEASLKFDAASVKKPWNAMLLSVCEENSKVHNVPRVEPVLKKAVVSQLAQVPKMKTLIGRSTTMRTRNRGGLALDFTFKK